MFLYDLLLSYTTQLSGDKSAAVEITHSVITDAAKMVEIKQDGVGILQWMLVTARIRCGEYLKNQDNPEIIADLLGIAVCEVGPMLKRIKGGKFTES